MFGAAARLVDPVSHDQAVPCGTIGAPLVPPPLAGQPVLIEEMPAAYVTCTAVCSGATSAGPAHPPVPPAGAGGGGGGGATAGADASSGAGGAAEAAPGKKTFEIRVVSGGLAAVAAGLICGPEIRSDSLTLEIRDPATGERAVYGLLAGNIGGSLRNGPQRRNPL